MLPWQSGTPAPACAVPAADAAEPVALGADVAIGPDAALAGEAVLAPTAVPDGPVAGPPGAGLEPAQPIKLTTNARPIARMEYSSVRRTLPHPARVVEGPLSLRRLLMTRLGVALVSPAARRYARASPGVRAAPRRPHMPAHGKHQ
jgi:hypothetical protein